MDQYAEAVGREAKQTVGHPVDEGARVEEQEHRCQEAHEWLLQRGFIPEYGAREMDRVIAAHLKPLLMREILFGTLKAGGKVRVQVENGALKLQPATE